MFYRKCILLRWVSVLAVTLGLLVPGGLGAAGARFVNNGDGTITDHQTGLMWEVKDDSGSIHDQDTPYTWANSTAVFLPGINSNIHDTETDTSSTVSFASGYTDWRIPTVVEFQTILDVTQGNCGGGSGPCVDAIFNTNCTAGCRSTALDPTNACSGTTASFGRFGHPFTHRLWSFGVRNR